MSGQNGRKKYLGYRRVSRVGERGERLRSLDFQAHDIEAAARREHVEVEMLPPEVDVSGSKESRVVLDEAIRRVQRGEVAGIIVARLDRLSRMPTWKTLRLIEEELEAHGGRVISAREDLSNEMVRTIMAATSRDEWQRKASGFEVAKSAAIAAGRWTARKVPLGYVKNEEGRLEPDPATAPLVRELFERRARGESWWKLSRWLGDALDVGVMNPQRLQYMIASRTYLGESRQGEHVNPEAHEPIVDRSTWLAAQRKAPRQPRSGEVKLLTGLVRCDSCGYAMSVNSNGRGVRNYVCARRDVCPAPAQIQARLLEPFVEEWYLTDLRERGQLYGIGKVQNDAELKEAERDLERAEDRLRGFLAPEIQDTLEPAAFAAGVRERQELVERATERVAELRVAQGAPAEPQWFEAAETWPILPVEHKRDILRSVVEEVRVARGRGKVDERVRVVRKS